MRYLELIVADLPDSGTAVIRTEWVNPANIETIEAYLEQHYSQQLVWLVLVLTTGRSRYIPLRPLEPGDELIVVAGAGIADLFASTAPIHAAATD